MTEANHTIETFWAHYLSTLPASQRGQTYFEATAWGNSAELADRIARLIAAGTKTTTSSLAWAQQLEGWPIPQPGDKSIVLNADKTPACIIETISIVIQPFNAVDAEFVYKYGEGDRTMNFWNNDMWDYYQEECAKLGKAAARDMPMICEEFKLVYAG